MYPVYNRVTVTGRLTADSVWRRTRTGRSVSNFYLTHYHRKSTGTVDASSFQITAYGEVADRCADLRVGQAVLVEGRLHEDRWMGSDDRRRSKIVIIAERVQRAQEPQKTHRAKAAAPFPQQHAPHSSDIAHAAAG